MGLTVLTRVVYAVVDWVGLRYKKYRGEYQDDT